MTKERQLDAASLQGYSIPGLTNVTEELKDEARGLCALIASKKVELRTLEGRFEGVQGNIRSLEALIGVRTEAVLREPLINRRDLLTPELIRVRSAIIRTLSFIGDKDCGLFRGELSATLLGANLAQITRMMLLQASEANTTLVSRYAGDLGEGEPAHLKTSSQLGPDFGKVFLTASASTSLEGIASYQWDNFCELSLVSPFAKRKNDYIEYAVVNQDPPSVFATRHFTNGHNADRSQILSLEAALPRIQDIKAALEKVG